MRLLSRTLWRSGLFCMMVNMSCAEAQKIFYPKTETDFDERTGFPLTLLQLVFDRIENGDKYTLLPTPIKMPRGRALKLLEQDVVVNIQWTMTSAEREQNLLAIKFPIYQGYMGWRIFLIKKENKNLFHKDMSLNKLRQLVAVQAPDWADTQILRSNGIQVVGASSYAELFSMIELGRADYLPRSVLEIWSEAEHFATEGLMVEKNILLTYPAEMYFFVNKKNQELAKDIEFGLSLAKEDGSYHLLFDSVHGRMLEQANLDARTRFDLDNSF
jgi:hypothetical protein